MENNWKVIKENKKFCYYFISEIVFNCYLFDGLDLEESQLFKESFIINWLKLIVQ